MATSSWIHTHSSKTLGSYPLLAVVGNFPNQARYCLSGPLEKLVRVNACSPDATQNSPSSLRRKNPLRLVLDTPRIIWNWTLQLMSDFGFGRRSVWVGGVGLFIVSGVALFALTLAWLRGLQLRSRFRKYQAVFEFSQACGICVGTPVRIQGVTVGNVVHVDSSMKCIEAVAEIEAMAEDIQPLLADVRNTSLLKDEECLTKNLAEATEELRKAHTSIFTPETTEETGKSIVSLIFTLENVESISSDISGFTSDEATRRNLRMLIKSLSRLL